MFVRRKKMQDYKHAWNAPGLLFWNMYAVLLPAAQSKRWERLISTSLSLCMNAWYSSMVNCSETVLQFDFEMCNTFM